jgi:hypothetical protein
MRAPSDDDRRLAAYMLDQETTDANQRAMLLRVIYAPMVEETELAELRKLGAGQSVQRDRMWKDPD